MKIENIFEKNFLAKKNILVIFHGNSCRALLMKIFNISKKALENKDHFSSLICQGVAIWISLQSIINICVCTGLFPTKGISLPFIYILISVMFLYFFYSNNLLNTVF